MVSSSKVQFKLDKLRAKALESIDFQIALTRKRLASFGDENALNQQIDAWRQRQESRISEVFHQLGPDDGIDNYRLAQFKLDPMPTLDRGDLRRVEYRLRELEVIRSQILAKSEALVPDADGNIALTKTQLQEFFGL